MPLQQDFSEAIHPLVAEYRKRLADIGQYDPEDDWSIARKIGQDRPDLLQSDPTFGKLFGDIREANAPSLPTELGNALKQATIGLGSTAVGGAALFTGSDYLKRKARAIDLYASDPALAPTIGTLEDIAPGETSTLKKIFSRDALRYATSKFGQAAPSITESVATGLAGAAIGSAMAPGPGTLVGGAEGLLAKAAIKSIIKKGIAEKMVADGLLESATESAFAKALKAGSKLVAANVSKEAAAIGGFRGGVAANAAGSVLLNSGDVASEGADRSTSIGLGLLSAIPDTILPAYVLKKFFPGLEKTAAKEASKLFLVRNAKKIGELAGIPAVEFGQEYYQQGINIVARNMKDGKDPLTFTPENLREMREAGITGAAGGLLAAPGVMFSGNQAAEPAAAEATPPPPPPATGTVPPAAGPLPAPVPAGPRGPTPLARARALTPEQQVLRLKELEAKTRTPLENSEYALLQTLIPPTVPTVAPIVPPVVAPVVAPPVAPVVVPVPAPAAAALPPQSLSEIKTSMIPAELAAANGLPVAPPAAPAQPQAQIDAENAAAAAAEENAQNYALPLGQAGVPIAPELAGMAPPEAPTAPAPAVAPAVLGDQLVKIPAKRAKTGETVEVEMPAFKAEKMISSRINVLEKLIVCLGT